MKPKPGRANRKTPGRTELRRASAQAVRRLARDGGRELVSKTKPQRRSKGAALVTGRFALFAFTCAAAFSLAVMLMVASWGKARAPKRAAQAGPA
jgi:hypothetical protein